MASEKKILGNFTKEELPTTRGFALPVGVGHAGDYNGYTVSYREYQSRDSYRKALTAYGPHTADYMVTRLVRMAGALKGGPALAAEAGDAQAQADEQRQEALATAIGAVSGRAYDGWRASLPADVGPVVPSASPRTCSGSTPRRSPGGEAATRLTTRSSGSSARSTVTGRPTQT